MKQIRYTVENLEMQGANAYFKAVSPTDTRPVVQLPQGIVTTMGQLAKTFPRAVDSDNGHFDFLILSEKHMTVSSVQAWWDGLRRMDIQGCQYTMLKGKESLTQSDYTGLALCSRDNRVYKLTWEPVGETAIPLYSPEYCSDDLDPFPDFDWEHPTESVRVD